MGVKRVLIADDEAAFTRIVKLSLELGGSHIVRVESKGARVVEAVREFKPDLVFLDIKMPDVEGCEVARRLKADDFSKNTPVVFLTALVQKSKAGKNRLINDHPFLAKPVGIKDLVECIEQYAK